MHPERGLRVGLGKRAMCQHFGWERRSTVLSHPAGLATLHPPPPARWPEGISPRRALWAGARGFPRKALIPRAGGEPRHRGVAWPWTFFLGRVWSPLSHPPPADVCRSRVTGPTFKIRAFTGDF